MKRILYSSGGFLTEDEIADALMGYASVLAIIDSADLVSVPGLDETGATRSFQLVVGPASQILAISTDEPETDLDGGSAAADLRGRAEARLPTSLAVGDSGERPAETDAESTTHGDPGSAVER